MTYRITERDLNDVVRRINRILDAPEAPYIKDATGWVIVRDPPNEMRTFWICDTESEARKCLDTWRMNGNGAHCTILPPTVGAAIL